ncbi:MAG: hypothetical protein Q7S92_05765, partial [Candidatus Diapherotrites archaeon]|nr:hypothetical protein [Candidatus Diapherotrites archaeon]
KKIAKKTLNVIERKRLQREVRKIQLEIRVHWLPVIRKEVIRELKRRKFNKKTISTREVSEIARKFKRYPRDIGIALKNLGIKIVKLKR